jgi:hypothetical protein
MKEIEFFRKVHISASDRVRHEKEAMDLKALVTSILELKYIIGILSIDIPYSSISGPSACRGQPSSSGEATMSTRSSRTGKEDVSPQGHERMSEHTC